VRSPTLIKDGRGAAVIGLMLSRVVMV